MARGRKPKPTKLKILDGNPGKRQLNGREPRPRGKATMPHALDGIGKRLWRKIFKMLEPLGLATDCDSIALELLCDHYSEWRAARAIIRKQGTTMKVTTKSGVTEMIRPEVRIAADASRRIKALLVEIGLTPSARSRVAVDLPGMGGKAAADLDTEFENILKSG